MKKLVKIISVMLALISAISALTACGGNNSSKSDVPVGGDGKFTIPEMVISDETVYTEGVFKYALYDNGTAVIVEHTGSETEIVIPDLIGGYPVVAIGAGAFYENQSATSVKMGKNLEIIGASAFNGCMMLSNVEIPEKVWSIYLCRIIAQVAESVHNKRIQDRACLLYRSNGLVKEYHIEDGLG